MISCGKKNGITVATLTVMIAREIGVAAKVPVPETKTSTLYGSMVGADEPKKAGKRAVKAPVTLSNVPLAQQGIMNRAMELIGTSSTASADCSVRSQAIQGSSSRRTSDALNNTHIFGESALAGLYGSSSRMTGAEDPSDPFPLTQGFAPSALGSMHAATTSAYREQLGANSPPRGDYTAPSPTHQRKSRSRSHSVQSDEGRWPDAGEAGGVYFSWDDEGVLAHDQNDDAFLHFSPERRAAQINPIQDIPTLQDEPRLFAPKPTSKKDPKGKKKAAMASTVDDWESRLKDLIVADKELHLRILRYEPIPFSTFMEKVGMNLSAQTQKQKLRGVLDELGVNTYAVSGMIGRKRTKK
ncbi:hypothetical protein BDV98DRAFT_560925 [Pterulicium gracile]|uniref:Structure-specific endonuclease subunit SLX4 n=1 Tax=Pterulicium gracile TaxID=1884261 RepID=A0A5C3R074_9AGAR|nr:hypothetical protein BDV98DRAFT_560925 [Pterula gracilis]